MVRIKPTVILGREAGFSEEGVHCKLHNMNINGHRFLERTKILRKNEIFRKNGVVQKKRTMDERLGSFREMKKRFEIIRTILKNYRFFTGPTNCPTIVSNK